MYLLKISKKLLDATEKKVEKLEKYGKILG